MYTHSCVAIPSRLQQHPKIKENSQPFPCSTTLMDAPMGHQSFTRANYIREAHLACELETT